MPQGIDASQAHDQWDDPRQLLHLHELAGDTFDSMALLTRGLGGGR